MGRHHTPLSAGKNLRQGPGTGHPAPECDAGSWSDTPEPVDYCRKIAGSLTTRFSAQSPVNVNIVHFPDLYFFKEAIIGRINGMFERYTEAARGVVVSSKHKASHVGSPEIDTEHLLLGLLSKDQTLARRFLGSPWAADLVWRRIEQSGKIGEPIKGPCDLPLSSMCKRALSYAAEEADGLSSKHISTEHLLLGLLREQKCFAAEYLYEHGVRLASVREELKRTPHKYSASDKFVREAALPEDVVEQQNRVSAIFQSVREAVAQRDFDKARQYSNEERIERDKLRSLYQRYGLLDWLYE